jgi:hypothetical protein
MKHTVAIIILTLCYFSCSTPSRSNTTSSKGHFNEAVLDFSSGPPTILYKTNDVYHDKIPVLLSEDKKIIINYPHPKDVFFNGNLAMPSKLVKGYFLDNRGIGKNSAFLSLTYKDYAQLESAPELSEMEKMIVDKDPIIELYDCGNRNQFKDEIQELNQLIEGNKLGKCKRIK